VFTVTVLASTLKGPKPWDEATSNSTEPFGPTLPTSPLTVVNAPTVTPALAYSTGFRLLGSGDAMTACAAALVDGVGSAVQPTTDSAASAHTQAPGTTNRS